LSSCEVKAKAEGEAKVKLCLELPAPLDQYLEFLSQKMGVRVEELILEAIENYVRIVERVDKHYMAEHGGG